LTQLPATFMLPLGAVSVLDAAIPKLLKESVLAPVIAVVPSKVTVPLFALKVPALIQLPATFISPLGAVRVSAVIMSMLLKEVLLAPVIAVVPSKVTVPPLAVKVPALTQLPATFIFAFKGPVNVLEAAISRLLNELVLAPVIAVVPSKVTVPPLAVNVPTFTQLPATFIFAAGAVNVLDKAISRLLKELVLPPVIAVVPSKFTVPLFAVKVPAFTQLPETFILPLGAVNVPDEILTLVVLTVPPAPVNVPPLIVNPPLRFWVVLEPSYVPPLMVVSPVTELVLLLALNMPLDTSIVPVTDNGLVNW